MNGILRRRNVQLAGLAAVAIVAVVAGWVATASLQQDFAAYWVAGSARRAGLDPYVNQVGGPAAPALWDGVGVFAHSRFLYSPLVAELFRPLAWLPYAAAKAVFTALAVAAWAVASVLAARAAGARQGAAATLVAGALAFPLYLHLERGQVDLFVLVLLVVALDARTRPSLAGAALAAAATFKPALLVLVPVLAALGRWRVAAAALAGAAVVVLATALLSGPALLREYAVDVLPRAALYGEGGDESMLLPEERLAGRQADLEAGVARLDGRVYRLAAWDGPASASLPRLLAPERPSPLVTRLTALALLAGLVAAALAVRRRGRAASPSGTSGPATLPATPAAFGGALGHAALILWAAVVACVVGSPAGWVMGLVWALPLVPWLARARGEGDGSPRAWWLAVAAGVGCAVPPPFAGWAAVAGTALVAAVVVLALSGRAGAAEAA